MLSNFVIDNNRSLMQKSQTVFVTENPEILNELSWFVNGYLQIYADLIETYQKQISGHKLVYGLDNDIILSYINPWLREIGHARIVEYIIENDSNYFTLIPGTVEEIYQFLIRSQRQKEFLAIVLNKLVEKNVSTETLESATNLLNDSDFGNLGFSAKTDLKSISISIYEQLGRIDFSINRLESLLNDERFIPLGDLFDHQDISVFDQSIMQKIYVQLSRIRNQDNKIKANKADAKNIATIIEYSKHISRKYQYNNIGGPEFFLRLLTATNSLMRVDLEDLYVDTFRQQIGKPIAPISRNIYHSTAIRSCYEALFSTIITKSCNNDYGKCLQEAYEILTTCQSSELELTYEDSIRWNKRTLTGEGDTKRIEKLINNIGYKLLNDKYFLEFKNILLQDSIETSNKKSSLESDNEHWWENDNESNFIITENQIQSFSQDYITKLKIVNQSSSNLPLELLGFAEFSIKQENFERWTLVNNFTSTNKIVFNIDKYNNIFYASWDCTLTESQIIELINEFIFIDLKNLSSDFEGDILLEFENGNVFEKLCSINSILNLTYKSYTESLDILKNSEVRDLVPSKIICDSNLSYLSFDNMVVGTESRQGVLYTYTDSKVVDNMIKLFSKTFLWRENHWPYSKNIIQKIEKQIKDFIK